MQQFTFRNHINHDREARMKTLSSGLLCEYFPTKYDITNLSDEEFQFRVDNLKKSTRKSIRIPNPLQDLL